MSVCITTNVLDSRSIYPVLDPRRTAGAGPFQYGYALVWDGVLVTVAFNPGLSRCQMEVILSSSLSEAKEIQAWNIFANNFVDRIGSSSLGLPSSMIIQKGGSSGRSCEEGADTVMLCRYFAWPRGRTALYTFPPQDFWDFWGGCTVTFAWFSDTAGSNRWGNQTPQPVYPLTITPDRTLMTNAAGTGVLVIIGGAAFSADSAFLNSMGLNASAAVPNSPSFPTTPADGILVREINQTQVFVVFGGAGFSIPPIVTTDVGGTVVPIPGLVSLGFSPNDVRIIPAGGTAQLLRIPIDGTLLRGQNDPRVFLVDQGQLRLVTSPAAMDARCLPWRNVRIVINSTLSGLPHGPDLV